MGSSSKPRTTNLEAHRQEHRGEESDRSRLQFYQGSSELGRNISGQLSEQPLEYERQPAQAIQGMQMEDALRESTQLLLSIADTAHDAIVLLDHDGGIAFWNKAAERMFGYRSKDVLGQPLAALVISESQRASHGGYFTSFCPPERGGSLTKKIAFKARRSTGAEFHAECSLSMVNLEGNWSAIGILRDMTAEQGGTEEELRKLSQAVEQSPVSVVITDVHGAIEYVNPKFVELTGFSPAEVIGKRPNILKSGYTSPETYRDLWSTITAGREWRGELSNRKKNGELFWEYASISPIRGLNGTVTHFLAVKEDITMRKMYEEQLVRQAQYDQLTGLPNRLLALDRLSQVLYRARQSSGVVALMFVDLDNFKNINDTLGHAAGDQLLVDAAARLRRCVRTSDTIARLGGDEFLIVLPDLSAVADSEIIGHKILDMFSRPFRLNGQEFFITASVGVAFYPSDGDDPHILLRNADAALYRAKEQGRHTYRFFTSEMNQQALERLNLESHLRYAQARGELKLHMQSIVDLHSGQLVGAEALLRWRSYELGNVPPDRFIPLAEDTGLIIPIGEWVLETACQQATRWQMPHNAPLRVSVNVSPLQFQETNLVATVSRILEKTRLPPDCLELEITERSLLDDSPAINAMLQQLIEMGVCLAVDDFGTGYSALTYLKRFPLHALKIDRSFVRDVTTDPGDAALVSAIVVMAHSLGLKVIGEGVETEEQVGFLRAQRCDMAQGFYFSKPIPQHAFERLINAQRITNETLN